MIDPLTSHLLHTTKVDCLLHKVLGMTCWLSPTRKTDNGSPTDCMASTCMPTIGSWLSPPPPDARAITAAVEPLVFAEVRGPNFSLQYRPWGRSVRPVIPGLCTSLFVMVRTSTTTTTGGGCVCRHKAPIRSCIIHNLGVFMLQSHVLCREQLRTPRPRCCVVIVIDGVVCTPPVCVQRLGSACACMYQVICTYVCLFRRKREHTRSNTILTHRRTPTRVLDSKDVC